VGLGNGRGNPSAFSACRRGLTVRRVIEALAVWPNWDDLRREYPELEPEDIRQALAFAARNLDESVQPLETV